MYTTIRRRVKTCFDTWLFSVIVASRSCMQQGFNMRRLNYTRELLPVGATLEHLVTDSLTLNFGAKFLSRGMITIRDLQDDSM